MIDSHSLECVLAIFRQLSVFHLVKEIHVSLSSRANAYHSGDGVAKERERNEGV